MCSFLHFTRNISSKDESIRSLSKAINRKLRNLDRPEEIFLIGDDEEAVFMRYYDLVKFGRDMNTSEPAINPQHSFLADVCIHYLSL